MKFRIISVLCLLGCSCLIIISCKNENVEGVYVNNSFNNKDTLVLSKKKYHHKVYNKNSVLFFENSGNWKTKDRRVILDSFLINDNDLSDEFTYDKNDLMQASLPVSMGMNNVEIIINPDTGIRYQKIKSTR